MVVGPMYEFQSLKNHIIRKCRVIDFKYYRYYEYTNIVKTKL